MNPRYRVWKRCLVLGLLAGSQIGGCPGGTEDCNPRVPVQAVEATGTITRTLADQTLTDALPSDLCTATLHVGSQGPGFATLSEVYELPGIEVSALVSVDCHDGERSSYLTLDLNDDPRDWPLGEVPATSDAEIRVQALPCTDCDFCEDDLANAPFQLEVSAATGGPLPFPELVTEDFVREMKVDFETPTLTGGGADCEVRQFTGSLVARLDAADFGEAFVDRDCE